MKIHITCLSLLLSVSSFSSTAGLINLGAAKDYNTFIHHDFLAANSDVEGRMAVGGDVSINNYSVNIKNSVQLYPNSDNLPALVAGGNLAFSEGTIAGDVFVGGTYTQTTTGSIINGNVQMGGISPIDFDTEFNSLIQLSTNLSLLDPNGTTTLSHWDTLLNLEGAGMNDSSGDLHIFNLDQSDLSSSDYWLSEVDMDDTVLFNISGKDLTIGSANFGGSDGSLENMADNILFNFYEAESVNINAALFGSILAPTADIIAPQGVIWGQVIADSWAGNTQINDNPFEDTTTNIPEPSTLAIFTLAMFGMAARRFKK